MSHRIGTVQVLATALTVGPDAGPPTSAGEWLATFTPDPAPGGTKFVILHFTNASLPAGNHLDVDLGTGEHDLFTSADGAQFWTRPIRLGPGGTVTIRYLAAGGLNGHVTLTEYGRAEAVESGTAAFPGTHNLTNPDVFLLASPYAEPFNETRGICDATGPPNWENVACYPATDMPAKVAPSVCLFIHAEINDTTHLVDLSTCTGTLIGPDLVLCAGHCVSDPNNLNVDSGSVCFGFQTNCDGTRPAGYAPRFFKVNRAIRAKASVGALDYSLLQLKVPVPGVPSIPMRADVPKLENNEQVFEVHHPQGIPMKVSPRRGGAPAKIRDVRPNNGLTYLFVNTDLTGGSSGSALFDAAGRIIGVADTSGGCDNGFLSITEVLKDIAATPPLATRRDVMLVLDRSGSMSLAAGTGRTKIEEARDAAALFVELIRVGAGDRIGLVSFSTSASSPADFDIHAVDSGAKGALVGPAPFTGGIVAGLAPGGLTSIGGGLQAATAQFPAPGPAVNQRTVLLMTDGLQNTPPMIDDVAPALAGTDLSVIGFGAESSLDGVLLDRLAQAHGGLYTRAGSPLQLKKFFALAFGNLFTAGTLADPEHDLPASETSATIPFRVCSEDSITAVLGWERADRSLLMTLKAPDGALVTAGSPGVEVKNGQTWMFVRVPLPFGGARDGVWEVEVFRPGGGEFPPPPVDMRFFLNVVVDGGPRFIRLAPARRYYTGDPINPLVMLRNRDGTTPRDGSVHLTVTKPVNGAGNVLTRSGLDAASVIDGDAMPARQATLLGLETTSGAPAIAYVEEDFELVDDGDHEDGAMEPDGIFGSPLPGLLTREGTYTFRAVATYGDDCVGTREALWSLHVDVGIDPAHTDVQVDPAGSITITPADGHGNHLGPGRANDLVVTGIPGTSVTGPVTDNGDGTYTVPIDTDPGSSPGLVVGQPARPPVVLLPPHKGHCFWWRLLALALAILAVVLFILLLIT